MHASRESFIDDLHSIERVLAFVKEVPLDEATRQIVEQAIARCQVAVEGILRILNKHIDRFSSLPGLARTSRRQYLWPIKKDEIQRLHGVLREELSLIKPL